MSKIFDTAQRRDCFIAAAVDKPSDSDSPNSDTHTFQTIDKLQTHLPISWVVWIMLDR